MILFCIGYKEILQIKAHLSSDPEELNQLIAAIQESGVDQEEIVEALGYLGSNPRFKDFERLMLAIQIPELGPRKRFSPRTDGA